LETKSSTEVLISMAGTQTESYQPVGELFQYDPLIRDHDIRLLKLEERSSKSIITDGRIVGRLVHHSLDDLAKSSACKYYAISYTWGDPTPTDRLWLSEAEFLPIAASSAYILRRVTSDEYIWIDSVCINQGDEKEKSIQLRYMWGIYKYAKQVLVWPGEAEHNSDLAMELLFDIRFGLLTRQMTGRSPVILPQSHIEYLPMLNTALWRSSRPPIPSDFHFDPERWAALAKFLDRPWWRRAWTIQEAVAAKELTIVMAAEKQRPDGVVLPWKYFNDHTAGHVLQWTELVAVIKHLQTWRFLYLLEITEEDGQCDLPVYPEAVTSVHRVETLKPARDNQRPNFQDNLLLTMAADATDPRDKVFAVGSMSYGSLTEELWPNYELSVADVYINATQHLIVRDQYLMTLHMAGIGWRRNMEALPSWVPDYSTTRRTGTRQGSDFVLGNIARSAMFASASQWLSDANACVKTLGSWRQLIRIRGIMVDDITVVCRGLPSTRSIRRSMDSENWIDRKVIRSWLNMVRSQVCPGRYSKPYLGLSATKGPAQTLLRAPMLESHALASALIVGSSYEGQPMSFNSVRCPLELMYNTFKTCVEEGRRPSEISGSVDVTNGLDAYLSALDRLPSWTVFRTTTGYIGRGPPLLKKGDKICVFEGARTPFIIRKSNLTRYAPVTWYDLVGECYVEGLMRKEATHMSIWRWGLITLC
jgi:hypothetical protein